jgi:ferrous iron transport protein A
MEIGLHQLCPGMKARVTRLDCDGEFSSRLADFGLVPGTLLSCRYRSPGGSVTALELRHTVLAIRTGDLRQIHGEVV